MQQQARGPAPPSSLPAAPCVAPQLLGRHVPVLELRAASMAVQVRSGCPRIAVYPGWAHAPGGSSGLQGELMRRGRGRGWRRRGRGAARGRAAEGVEHLLPAALLPPGYGQAGRGHARLHGPTTGVSAPTLLLLRAGAGHGRKLPRPLLLLLWVTHRDSVRLRLAVAHACAPGPVPCAALAGLAAGPASSFGEGGPLGSLGGLDDRPHTDLARRASGWLGPG